MKPIDLALKYMEVFYESGDWESLYNFMDPNLQFIGPLFKFDNAKDYVNSLKESPPVGCTFRIVESYESESSACLIYEFTKDDIMTLMCQSFWVNKDRINKIILIFNAGDFI